MNPSSFTIAVSIYFLIAVVVGGAASIVGPAIGAVFYGIFNDVITPELPERLKPATPVILGVLLILLMLVAPGGIVGLWQVTSHRVTARRHPARPTTPPSSTPIRSVPRRDRGRPGPHSTIDTSIDTRGNP